MISSSFGLQHSMLFREQATSNWLISKHTQESKMEFFNLLFELKFVKLGLLHLGDLLKHLIKTAISLNNISKALSRTNLVDFKFMPLSA